MLSTFNLGAGVSQSSKVDK